MKKILLILSLFFITYTSFSQGVTVVDFMTTNGIANYPVTKDSLGKGGFRVVETIVERDAITDLRRKSGMWVFVTDSLKTYRLSNAGITNADWVEIIFSSAPAWGSITGMITSQTDLNDSLLARQRLVDTLVWDATRSWVQSQGYLTGVDTTNIANFSDKVRSLFSAGLYLTYLNGNYKVDTASMFPVIRGTIGNFANANLTQTANRTYAGAGFDYTLNNLGNWDFNMATGKSFNVNGTGGVFLESSVGSNYGSLTLNSGYFDVYGTDGNGNTNIYTQHNAAYTRIFLHTRLYGTGDNDIELLSESGGGINIKPLNGNLKIDSLTQTTAKVGKKVMLRDPANNNIYEISPDSIGVAASSTSWLLTGNSGTTAGTNFIGTTDAQDVVMKRNSVESFRLKANNSVQMGYVTTASGIDATSMGNFTTASGAASTSMGYASTASGSVSTAMGEGILSKSYGGTVVGVFNDSANIASATVLNSLNRIFQIGNGTADNARTNAMTVLGNGNTGIGSTELVPDSALQVGLGIWGKRGVRFSALPTAPGTMALRIDANGNITKADTTGATATPTLQQVLTAGSTLTTDNSIDAANNDFAITNVGSSLFKSSLYMDNTGWELQSLNGSYVTNILGNQDSTYGYVLAQAARPGSFSSLFVSTDSININPPLGNLKIDTLTKVPGIYAMRYNPTTGLVSYADTTTGGGGGGGITVGTTTITSGTNTRVPFNDGGVYGEDAGLTYAKASDELTVTGKVISPTIIGGTGTTADLNIQTTSGVGTTGADMHFLVGNNGATEAMTILNNGRIGFGGTPSAQVQYVLTDDATPSTVTAWDNRHVQWGTGGSTAPGLGMSYSSSTGTVNLSFLEPLVAWRKWSAGFGTASFYSGGLTLGFYQDATGRVGIQTTATTAALTLPAGTATANTAPLKFTSGALNTTAEVGAVEFLTDTYYGTITTGAARKSFAFLDAGQTFTSAVWNGTIVNQAYLGTGGGGATKFLREDNTWQTVSAGSGEANTASNVGAGVGWAKDKVGVDLRFKSATEGAGISLTSNTNDVAIAIKGWDVWSNTTVNTTTATTTTLSSIACPSDSRGVLKVTMVATETSSAANGLTGTKYIHWKSSGGVVTVLQVVDEEADYRETWTTATWTVDASGGNLRIRVTADNANSTDWNAQYQLKYNTYAL